MFPYEPDLSTYIDDPKIRSAVGDIRQPWVDLGNKCGVSPFATKLLFVLGLSRRYVLSANAVLKDMRHLGFLSAYGLLCSGIELLGRCVHAQKAIRQHPKDQSTERLKEGFNYVTPPRLRMTGAVVETNHYPVAEGGYNIQDLIELRNLTLHGSCITHASQIKSDIELLHQLRKAIYGVPLGEIEPHEGKGPLPGALDRYYEVLASGDREMCERLATAAISPSPLELQKGAWPFALQIISDSKQIIETNLGRGQFPVSGNHTKQEDAFQLYY